MPKPDLPERVRVGDRRDDVGPGVGAAGEPACEPGGREPAAGRAAVADRREVGLAHVDAVLGQHHRRAVQRLVHDGGDRRPAGGRDVQDVGLGRRLGRAARHPVERLVELRRLELVERRGRAGLRHALREHLAERGQEAVPGLARPERAPHPARVAPAPHQARREGARVAVPADQAAGEQRGQRMVRAAARQRRATAARQPLGPDLDRPQLARVPRQREAPRLSVGADDRQHVPVELVQAVDEQVAPRADAADDVRVRPLGREEHARALGGLALRGASSALVHPAPVARASPAAGRAGRRPRRARPGAPRRRPSPARSRGRSRSATRG